MRRLIQIAALVAAGWFAWDYFVVQGRVSLPERPRYEPKEGGEVRREPGRGLNPFVTDTDHGAAPQRPRVPDVPGR